MESPSGAEIKTCICLRLDGQVEIQDFTLAIFTGAIVSHLMDIGKTALGIICCLVVGLVTGRLRVKAMEKKEYNDLRSDRIGHGIGQGGMRVDLFHQSIRRRYLA